MKEKFLSATKIKKNYDKLFKYLSKKLDKNFGENNTIVLGDCIRQKDRSLVFVVFFPDYSLNIKEDTVTATIDGELRIFAIDLNILTKKKMKTKEKLKYVVELSPDIFN